MPPTRQAHGGQRLIDSRIAGTSCALPRPLVLVLVPSCSSSSPRARPRPLVLVLVPSCSSSSPRARPSSSTHPFSENEEENEDEKLASGANVGLSLALVSSAAVHSDHVAHSSLGGS